MSFPLSFGLVAVICIASDGTIPPLWRTYSRYLFDIDH